MNFVQWTDKYRISHNYTKGCICIHHEDIPRIALMSMYCLSDYVVSSYVAGVYWLIPRCEVTNESN